MRIIAQPGMRTSAENPYTNLLYQEVRKRGHEVADFTRGSLLSEFWHIWHMHWPDSALSSEAIAVTAWREAKKQLALIHTAKHRGTKVIWTIHNLKSHENRYPATAVLALDRCHR